MKKLNETMIDMEGAFKLLNEDLKNEDIWGLALKNSGYDWRDVEDTFREYEDNFQIVAAGECNSFENLLKTLHNTSHIIDFTNDKVVAINNNIARILINIIDANNNGLEIDFDRLDAEIKKAPDINPLVGKEIKSVVVRDSAAYGDEEETKYDFIQIFGKPLSISDCLEFLYWGTDGFDDFNGEEIEEFDLPTIGQELDSYKTSLLAMLELPEILGLDNSYQELAEIELSNGHNYKH